MGLTTPQELQKFAQGLSDCADAFNERIKAELTGGNISPEEAFLRLSKERLLREVANSLFLQAALKTINGLAESQANIDAAIGAAQAKIKSFQAFAKSLELVADLIALGTAVFAGKLPPIVAALSEVKTDLAPPAG